MAARVALRARCELDSELLTELSEGQELLLLGLRALSERLRGKVRSDGGLTGWVTIELPGLKPSRGGSRSMDVWMSMSRST